MHLKLGTEKMQKKRDELLYKYKYIYYIYTYIFVGCQLEYE